MPHSIRFGDYEFEVESKTLRRDGIRIPLQPQPAIILSVLLHRAGELVTRGDLRDALWPPNIFVEYERNLNRSVNKLRQSLNDSADHPRFIETIPGSGYRFIAEVNDLSPELNEVAPITLAETS